MAKARDINWTGKIPALPRAHYQVDVGWDDVEWHLGRWRDSYGLDMSPDYQRAHVWTGKQQRDYIAYTLAGGEVGKHIMWNCASWGEGKGAPMELVDGKQRLEAVRSFMRGEIEVYGHCYQEGDQLRIFEAGMKWRVCKLKTRAEVLNLYLNINAGGTPHTAGEISKVREMLGSES